MYIPEINYPTYSSDNSYIPQKSSEISFDKKGIKDKEDGITGNATSNELRKSDNEKGEDKKKGISLSKDEKLDNKEKQEIEKLQRTDSHVRAHEHAHIAAGGPYVRGGPFYSYVIGPDGKMYAVAGEVKIDVSPVPGDPDATIRKAEIIKRAALAPSDPSPQDLAVAAQADRMAMEARIEKLKIQSDKMREIFSQETDKSKRTYSSNLIRDNNFNPPPSGPSTLKKGIYSYKTSQIVSPQSTLHFVV